LAFYRLHRMTTWASTILFLCAAIAAASAWDWFLTGGHWYPSSIHATMVFLALGIYALTGRRIAQRCPGTTMNACVIPITMIAVSITLENPEVEVHYHAIMGETRRTMQLFFGWLKNSASTAEFDSFVTAASKAINSTSASDGLPSPISCVVQELQHASSVIDSRCGMHQGFAFNLMIGHAFLLSTAAASGLTCRCCMATWLLSQLSSMCLLVAHSAPSLKYHCYSVSSLMLLSCVLCLSVSLWTQRQATIIGLDSAHCPPPCTE